jgi:YidC/Oxa1 family membrane protein insertase
MFTTLIVQPIFNLLVAIYALLPGHNFGLAIILFTIVVRLLMWPLVKKQLHQVKLMRKAQPAIKEVKKAAKGDRRKESLLLMELYKERGISPFGQIGVMLLQVPILIGLYLGLQKIVKDADQIVSFAYPALQQLSWMKELATDVPKLFDSTLFGVVDLTRSALDSGGGIYWPAMIIVIGSCVTQFFASSQLMPKDKDARKLREILRDSKNGKQADQSEMNAAIGRSMRFFLPVLIFLFTVHLPSALGLYWLTSGLAAFVQQWLVLREDVEDMEAIADKPDKTGKKADKKAIAGKAAAREKQAIEAEIVSTPKSKKSSKARKKRRN